MWKTKQATSINGTRSKPVFLDLGVAFASFAAEGGGLEAIS
jgi:uncharacterized membrane protein